MEATRRRDLEEAAAAAAQAALNGEVFDSMQVEFDVDDDVNLADVEDGDEAEEEEEEEEEMEGYEMPIGPLPQTVTNDLKSLDEMVSNQYFLLHHHLNCPSGCRNSF